MEMIPTMEIPITLFIDRQTWEQMQLDVARRSPEEACGLLAGQRQGNQLRVSRLFITTNLLRSTTRYRIDPYEQLAAFNRMEAEEMELVGIYHSHPNGPDEPSPTDLAEAYYPEAAYLIWSKSNEAWACRAFAIQQMYVTPVRIEILEAGA
jgi:proteasome lid subunit RPN8/RPN11